MNSFIFSNMLFCFKNLFVKNLTSGGAEKQAVLLAKALSQDYDVHFIVYNAAKVHQKYLDLINEVPEIHLFLNQGEYIHRFRALCSYMRRYGIGLVFSYLTAANLYACLAGRLTGAKVVCGLRNAELPVQKRLVDRFLTNHMAALTVANCFSGKRNFVRQGFCERKIHVIPNCFEGIAPYKEKQEQKQTNIITVGRFVEQKDYLTAIRSVARAYQTCRDIRFCIIGFGKLEQQIRLWVKKEGIEDITEMLINPDDIPGYLDRADIYLSTSLFEGTSNSIMEAMNANLPVIATDVGDNRYLVKDGVNGFMAEKKDVAALADHIRTLAQDRNQRLRFGENSKNLLREKYSMDTFRDRYIEIIKELS